MRQIIELNDDIIKLYNDSVCDADTMEIFRKTLAMAQGEKIAFDITKINNFYACHCFRLSDKAYLRDNKKDCNIGFYKNNYSKIDLLDFCDILDVIKDKINF